MIDIGYQGEAVVKLNSEADTGTGLKDLLSYWHIHPVRKIYGKDDGYGTADYQAIYSSFRDKVEKNICFSSSESTE